MGKLPKMAIVDYIKNVLLMVKVRISPRTASKASKSYWTKCDKTHGDTSWKEFESYYKNIKEVMSPVGDDTILDAGCGSGELTYLFYKDGFNAKGFDSSEYLIEKAKKRFGDDLFYVDNLADLKTRQKFTKAFLNNAFFYIHPTYYKTALRNLYDITQDNSTVYLFDDPDYSKRNRCQRRLLNILTFFLPVYNAQAAGFWVKTKDVKKAAVSVGFSKVEKLDSWADYRSHYILLKEERK